MRGRKPNSSATRRLNNNAGHRAVNDREPQLPAATEDFDATPTELANDPIAIAYWTMLAPMLRQARQVTTADRGSLIALCLEWSRYREAVDKARAIGLVITSPSGYPMINPYIPIGNKALAACTKLWAELGLTPSSRSRVTLAGSPDEDDFDQFLKTPLRAVK